MQLIQNITVGAGGASVIEFTAIPGTFTDLLLVTSLRDSSGATQNSYSMTINNLTAANYVWTRLEGNGSSVNSAATGGSASESVMYVNAGSSTSNTFTNHMRYFTDYAATGIKLYHISGGMENNAPTAYLQNVSAAYNSSIGAITSIKLTAGSGFVQHSTATLYGILKGSGGATVS